MKNEYSLIAFIGEEHGGKGFPEMEFNPYEYAVIFRDHEDHEIWLNPDKISEMAEQLKEYAEFLKPLLKVSRLKQ